MSATLDPPTVMAGLGARTPVGLSWPAAAAAVRAGLDGFSLSEHLRAFGDGEPLKVSRVPTLPADASAYERMKLLAAGAAREALLPWRRSAGGSALPDLPVLLSLPPERPGF